MNSNTPPQAEVTIPLLVQQAVAFAFERMSQDVLRASVREAVRAAVQAAQAMQMESRFEETSRSSSDEETDQCGSETVMGYGPLRSWSSSSSLDPQELYDEVKKNPEKYFETIVNYITNYYPSTSSAFKSFIENIIRYLHKSPEDYEGLYTEITNYIKEHYEKFTSFYDAIAEYTAEYIAGHPNDFRTFFNAIADNTVHRIADTIAGSPDSFKTFYDAITTYVLTVLVNVPIEYNPPYVLGRRTNGGLIWVPTCTHASQHPE